MDTAARDRPHRWRRLRPQRLARPPVRARRHGGRPGGARSRQARRIVRRDRSACLRMRRHRRRPGGAPVRGGGAARSASPTWWSTTRRPGPAGRSSNCAGAGPGGIGRRRVRRLPGCPAGRPAHAAARPWRGAVHRRIRERQGLCAIGAVRDGQVRVARAGPEHGARARARRASTSRISSSTARSAIRAGPSRRTGRIPCSIPTPSRRAICSVLRQPRSAWTWEMELRPWVEKF